MEYLSYSEKSKISQNMKYISHITQYSQASSSPSRKKGYHQDHQVDVEHLKRKKERKKG
jgi:hypothetical protein